MLLRKTKIIVFIFILFVSHASTAEPLDTMLQGVDGKRYVLSDYIGKGKWLVLNVWGTDCPYCRAELDALIDFHELHHQKEAMVIGLTLDWPTFEYPDKAQLSEFVLDYFIEYPVLMVDAKLAAEVIGKKVDMIPITFIYNPAGELVLRLNGVVTYTQLEKIIKDDRSGYQIEWTDIVPPEFKQGKN